MKKPCSMVVLADAVRDEPTSLTIELLACARSLAGETAGRVFAVLVGAAEPAQAMIAHGADEVFAVAVPAGADRGPEGIAAALTMVCRKISPAVVLIGHTALGADVAPRLAFRLASGVATGCIEIAEQNGKYFFTRPRQGGIACEVLSFKTVPAVATLRAGSYEAAGRDVERRGRITALVCNDAVMHTRVIERRREPHDGKLRLEDAKVVVAGGRGLDGPEGFRLLETLADMFGGAVGASRVPCDLGWCPRSWQIGLTGRTVTPDLYIAVGISGAGHHLAGCGNAKAIVAINTDAGAAIFSAARYGIVGDYRQVVPALIEALQQAGSGTQMNADRRR